jgi:hypothetical protein
LDNSRLPLFGSLVVHGFVGRSPSSSVAPLKMSRFVSSFSSSRSHHFHLVLSPSALKRPNLSANCPWTVSLLLLLCPRCSTKFFFSVFLSLFLRSFSLHPCQSAMKLQVTRFSLFFSSQFISFFALLCSDSIISFIYCCSFSISILNIFMRWRMGTFSLAAASSRFWCVFSLLSASSFVGCCVVNFSFLLRS